MDERQPKYRDFSEMPDDVLRAFLADLANPSEALRRIRASKTTRGGSVGERPRETKR